MQQVLNTEVIAFLRCIEEHKTKPTYFNAAWWSELASLCTEDMQKRLLNPRQIYNWLLDQRRTAITCESKALLMLIGQAMQYLKKSSDPRAFLNTDELLDKLLPMVDITPGASLPEEACTIIVDLKYIRFLETQTSP